MNTELEQQLRLAKDLAANRFLGVGFPSIVGVGIGQKVVRVNNVEKPTDTLCVRIYVEHKEDLARLGPGFLVPPTILDVPTDVIEIGRFLSVGRLRKSRKFETPQPGGSIGVRTAASNVNPMVAGTLGAVVTAGQQRYVLGCNHILAVNGRVLLEDRGVVVSPALPDAEKPSDVRDIATLANFIELKRDQRNRVDCAVALVDANAVVSAVFPSQIGRLSSPDALKPERGHNVMKVGRITGCTEGTIVDVNADFLVDYSFGTFRFTDQVLIQGKDGADFAKDGDSGAVLVDKDKKQAVAMVFASAGELTLACPMSEVLDQLGVTLVVE